MIINLKTGTKQDRIARKIFTLTASLKRTRGKITMKRDTYSAWTRRSCPCIYALFKAMNHWLHLCYAA